MNEENGKSEEHHPRFMMSVDAQILSKRLSQAATGEVVSYGEMTELINRDVTGTARSVLVTARRDVMREHRMVFEAVISVGIKRLSDSTLSSVGTASLRRIHRAAVTGMRKLACVNDFEAMTKEEKIRHNTSASVLGAIKQSTLLGSIQKVEHVCQQADGRMISFDGTIKAFSQ